MSLSKCKGSCLGARHICPDWGDTIHHLHWGFAKLKLSICPFWLNITQMQTPATTPTLDISVPMDINQSRPRHETHTCNDCGKKGHLSQVCPKPQKQRIWLTKSADTDIKSLIAKVVMATMLIY